MIEIDIDSLRENMKDEYEAAFFAGGYGGALIELEELDNMSDEEVINAVARQGFDLNDYIVNEHNKKLNR